MLPFRFNLSVQRARVPERASTLREMIARPKISRNEWKTTEMGAFEVGNFALFSCPEPRLGERAVLPPVLLLLGLLRRVRRLALPEHVGPGQQAPPEVAAAAGEVVGPVRRRARHGPQRRLAARRVRRDGLDVPRREGDLEERPAGRHDVALVPDERAAAVVEGHPRRVAARGPRRVVRRVAEAHGPGPPARGVVAAEPGRRPLVPAHGPEHVAAQEVVRRVRRRHRLALARRRGRRRQERVVGRREVKAVVRRGAERVPGQPVGSGVRRGNESGKDPRPGAGGALDGRVAVVVADEHGIPEVGRVEEQLVEDLGETGADSRKSAVAEQKGGCLPRRRRGPRRPCGRAPGGATPPTGPAARRAGGTRPRSWAGRGVRRKTRAAAAFVVNKES